MKREIKFKGQKRNGAWLFGDLVQRHPDYLIFPLEAPDSHDNYIVICDTISQFTGLKNKTGVEIYENDIFNYKKHNGYLLEDFQGEVAFEDGCFGYKVITGETYKQFTPFSDIDCLQQDFLDHIEVVFS